VTGLPVIIAGAGCRIEMVDGKRCIYAPRSVFQDAWISKLNATCSNQLREPAVHGATDLGCGHCLRASPWCLVHHQLMRPRAAGRYLTDRRAELIDARFSKLRAGSLRRDVGLKPRVD
jgi:hypothetical protein